VIAGTISPFPWGDREHSLRLEKLEYASVLMQSGRALEMLLTNTRWICIAYQRLKGIRATKLSMKLEVHREVHSCFVRQLINYVVS